MDVKKFFKDNPNAPYIIQVGDRYFLKHAESQAKDYARISGKKPVKIVNPTLEKKSTSSKKELLQAQASELGIEYKPNTTVKQLEKLIAEAEQKEK